MKQITTILFLLLICLTVSSQATKEFDDRINSGKLTYKECERLVESGDAKSALPSLYNLLKEYEYNHYCPRKSVNNSLKRLSALRF